MNNTEIIFNDEFVSKHLTELLDLKIDRSIITGEQISRVTELLELKGNTALQLTAKRNSVVKLLTKNVYDDSAWATMSGVTCVIDSYIIKLRRI